MATVTYIGGESAGPTLGTHWDGVQFPINVPVKVTDKDLLAKLKQHPHFSVDGKVYGGPDTEAPAPADEAPQA